MNREAALADFEAARAEWAGALARVPDAALRFLKAGDDYALGGLQVHVNWVLTHYRRVLDGIVRGGFGPMAPVDGPDESAASGARAKAGLTAGERAPALDEMDRLHAAVLSLVTGLPAEDWSRKADVVYAAGVEPYPTSPEDIVGWLRDHYREHVEQSGQLVDQWRSASGASEPF